MAEVGGEEWKGAERDGREARPREPSAGSLPVTGPGMARLEVRCCCRPQKLRGWLQVAVPRGGLKCGHVVTFVKRRTPKARELVIRDALPLVDQTTLIKMEVGQIQGIGREPYLAIKSEHLELEELRLLPGFEENKGG